jgi:hypothetical protein
MPAPTWAVDLQGVRALAHKLYCSCMLPIYPARMRLLHLTLNRSGIIKCLQTARQKRTDSTQ